MVAAAAAAWQQQLGVSNLAAAAWRLRERDGSGAGSLAVEAWRRRGVGGGSVAALQWRQELGWGSGGGIKAAVAAATKLKNLLREP